MLDHVFTDAIGALRSAFEDALLEQNSLEERFQSDVLLGDLTWSTSYTLPGEVDPPPVQADITLEWPTWAQTAYRAWTIGETWDDPPSVIASVAFRVQGLASEPNPAVVLSALPATGLPLGTDELVRAAPTTETQWSEDLIGKEYSAQVVYEGVHELGTAVLKDGSVLDENFSAAGVWIASTLVRLADLDLDWVTPSA